MWLTVISRINHTVEKTDMIKVNVKCVKQRKIPYVNIVKCNVRETVSRQDCQMYPVIETI